MSDEFMQNNTNNVEPQPTYQQPQYQQPQYQQAQPTYQQPQQTYQAQPQYQQPQYQQNYGQPMYQQPQGKGLAIASMVCGIVSCVFCFAWYIVIPTSIVAIILGIVYKKKGLKNGMATAGITCGIVGLSLFILFIVLIFVGVFATYGLMDSYGYYY